MQPQLRVCLALLTSLLASLALTACGSSGGGSSSTPGTGLIHPNSRFTGTFVMAGLLGDTGPEEISGLFGEFIADGDGNLTFAMGDNTQGVVTPVGVPNPTAFAVGFDGTIDLGLEFPGAGFFQGGLSETGDAASMIIGYPGWRPTAVILGKPGPGPYDEGSVTGSYHLGSYQATTLGPQNGTWWGQINFDGAGNGTYSVMVNQEGIVVGPVPMLHTYTVAADGTLTIEFGPGNTVQGTIVGDGNLLVAGGSQVAGENMRLSVMTRQGAGHATADMEGYWFITGFGHDLASNSYYAFEGVLGSNALGDTSILVQSSDGTDLTVDPALAGAVSLAADGTLELNTGGPIFRGGVSADGRYAVMAGGAVGGDDPVILFLMR